MADRIGPMGWGDPALDAGMRLDSERRQLYAAQCAHPVAFKARRAKAVSPAFLKRLQELHDKRGIADAGVKSIDLRVISELLFGQLMQWPAQLIGSCVASGGMRAWGLRSLFEVAAVGDSEEPIGRSRLGFNSLMPFGPYNYGVGRRLGRMRGGDGSYCSVHVQGFQRYGVIPCSTAKLQQIVGSRETDYPETQSTNLYRQFGDWQHLDTLEAYADYPLLESEEIRRGDRAKVCLVHEYKPMMICSNWGFARQSRHKDGFWVYRRSGTWAHNMTICGWIVASDGNEFVIVLNSWGPDAHEDGEYFVIPAELFDQWLPSASCQTIGDIDLPDSLPLIW